MLVILFYSPSISAAPNTVIIEAAGENWLPFKLMV